VHVHELFDLSGKTALVTGGGRGIGRHLAIGLAEAGADVVVASRKLANCEEAAEAVAKRGRLAWALEADVASPEAGERLADETLERVSRLDILVNNAGATWGAPTLDYPLEGWDRVFDLNVRGLFLLTQRIARHMKDQGGGVIVNVGSVAGFRGAPETAMPAIAYNASKGAVLTLTKDLAVKLAPYGIRVNGIAPGPFLTDMMNHVRRDPQILEAYHATIPLHRSGEEDDIKGVMVFLAGPASAYMTGHTVVVDGGVMAG